MAELGNLKRVLHQWGGTISSFFAYTHFSHDMCAALLTAMLPLIRAELGLSYLQSGLLLSSFSITSGLSQFIGGWFGDRFSRRTVIAIGLGGVGLASLAIGLNSSYYPMLAILVIMGIFSGAYHPSATSLLSGYFEEARRGKVIAIHSLGGSFGFAAGPILGGLLAQWLGWQFAFIILSIPALAAVVLVFKKFRKLEYTSVGRSVDRASTEDAVPDQPVLERTSLGQVLRTIATITTLAVLTQFVAGSAMAFIPIYLVDKHGFTPANAAMLTGIVRGGSVVGSLFGGWLSDKWGRRNTIFLINI